jgi:hypothetical protein
MIARGLDGMARLAAAAGHFERAARLFGASQSLLSAAERRLDGPEAATFEAALAATRAQLDQAAFAAAWAEGQAMPLEQAVAYALEEAPDDA